MSEEEIIEGCKKKHPKYQKQLYTIYAPKMLAVCKRYVNDMELAKDVLHDAFIKVFTRIDTYKGNGSFGGWIQRVFVTTALEQLRKDKIFQSNISIDNQQELADGSYSSAISEMTAEELMTCISKLPTGYRTVFNLYAIEGYSHAEIAELLNIKESTSQSQLVKARKMLKANIKTYLE